MIILPYHGPSMLMLKPDLGAVAVRQPADTSIKAPLTLSKSCCRR
jgi:hypothetical protein